MEFDSIIDYVVEKMDGFPEIDYRFTTMNNYISEVTEFLEFTYAQKVQRLKAKIATADDPVEKGEMEDELIQLENEGMEYLSHIIWGGVLVSIFATYESSLQDLFSFFEKRQGIKKFRKERGKTFIECAQNHSLQNLKATLYSGQADRFLLEELSKLRNSYVHNDCNLSLLPIRLRDAILENKYKEYSLNTREGKWVANAKNARLYFKYVYESFVSYRRRVTDILMAENT